MAKYFQTNKILVRLLPKVTIIFYDRQTIYVFPKGYQNGTIFHLWGAPRGEYTHKWKPFRLRLLRNKLGMDIAKCHKLADKYGVVYVGTCRALKFDKKIIEYRNY